MNSPLSIFIPKLQDETLTGAFFVILGAAALVKDGNVKEVTQLPGNSLHAFCVDWGLVRSLTAQLLSETMLKPTCKLKKNLPKSKLVALRPWCQITAVCTKFCLVVFFLKLLLNKYSKYTLWQETSHNIEVQWALIWKTRLADQETCSWAVHLSVLTRSI